MFPVPQHLPRSGGDKISSKITENNPDPNPDSDPVLDLIQPLLNNESKFTGNQVKDVRQNLENAVNENKRKTHDLLINNFPSISTQIQLSTSLHSDISNVQFKLSKLESEIDPSDTKISFLPPLIDSLNRHFSASSSRSAAQSHVKALKTLSKRVEKVKRFEEAVWTARSADEWVLNQVIVEKGFTVVEDEDERIGEKVLQGTKLMLAIQAKESLLKSMVIEQITDGFNSAISFSAPVHGKGASLSVQSHIALQHPRTTPPRHFSSATSTHYPIAEIYNALSKLALLDELLRTLTNRLQKDLIQPIVSSSYRASISSTDKLSILRLTSSSSRSPIDALQDIKISLDFIADTVFPSSSSLPERETFLSSLSTSAFQSILDSLIHPALPSSLDGVSGWLSIIQQAVEVETTFSKQGVLAKFFERDAGVTWAQQRRYAVADEVRRLILSGWGGWENESKGKEREVITYIEVEVDEPMSIDEPEIKEPTNGEDGFGWGFDVSPEKEKVKSLEKPAAREDVTMEDDGWGFEESSSVAGPSSPPKATMTPPTKNEEGAEEEEDGWDLDPSPSPSQPPSVAEPESNVTSLTDSQVIAKPAKPAREAKRLGKKVAKVKHEEDEYDSWAEPVNPRAQNGSSSNKANHLTPVPSPKVNITSIPLPESKENSGDDGWGWDDDTNNKVTSQASSSTARPEVKEPPRSKKRKEMREEKSTIRENFLVSTSCETLLGIAKSVLTEIEAMKSSKLSSPAFDISTLEPILIEAIKEVFTLYRALLPTHFANQLRDVPSLSMQAYNDTLHLSTLISSLAVGLNLQEEKERLEALGDHIFQSQLEVQRIGLIDSLEELDGLEGTSEEKIFRKAEKSIKGLIHNLESLSRVVKPILPTSKYLETISYLLTTLIIKITNDILNLGDITEIESHRLTDLIKLIYPLEGLFENHGGVVRFVNGWLKFCYIAEILQASLVDITYLIDSGSLVDFTSDELITLVRALFASSEKRDTVVEKIEREGTSGGSNSSTTLINEERGFSIDR
ncbi:uncharacterized protein IL334_000284 [Kwoniella shivajii]|uniref:ZW10 C-terminal helical domain-containing protein n=1 Tax=Kwoniella shivajii TaxID=564305 RepID=A0ABZ1CQ71_9TREE|nr:hypothetical protein IL334_000284 [Kwoniella shivajii]